MSINKKIVFVFYSSSIGGLVKVTFSFNDIVTYVVFFFLSPIPMKLILDWDIQSKWATNLLNMHKYVEISQKPKPNSAQLSRTNTAPIFFCVGHLLHLFISLSLSNKTVQLPSFDIGIMGISLEQSSVYANKSKVFRYYKSTVSIGFECVVINFGCNLCVYAHVNMTTQKTHNE